MTYNVRSCRGTDGRVLPERIAEVIAGHRPDVLALQELDKGLKRSGGLDQGKVIARALNMKLHFHPSFDLEEGFYGNAVLCRFPMTLVRAGRLPTLARRRIPEQRGAIWIRFNDGAGAVDFLTTHLGLLFSEKIAQARELVSDNWLGSPLREGPTIFCGDLNATDCSFVHRIFRKRLRPARPKRLWPAATWPSRFPVRRLDHIFCSGDFRIRTVQIAGGRLERRASDHLPVIAEMDRLSQRTV